MTKKEAIELSIKKWEWIVENQGFEDNDEGEEVIDAFPQLERLLYNCPLCELYIEKDNEGDEYCDGCPLDVIPKSEYTYTKENVMDVHRRSVLLKGCCQESHPWSIWDNDKNKVTAQAVLDLLKNIK